MTFPRTSTVALDLVPILVVMALATDADAQRRRRRRPRKPPPPAAEPAEVSPEAAGDDGAGEEVGSPSAEPAPGEAAGGEDASPAAEAAEDLFGGADLGPLREQLTAVMDDLVKARSRIAVLGRQLFKTRVRISVDNDAGADQMLTSVSLLFDGAPIFRAEAGGFSGRDPRQVFDGFAAPGPHTVTVEVEQRARADEAYRYTLRDTYRFQVIKGKLIEIKVVLDDDSDIAEDFPDDEEGEYDVRTRVRVATRALE